MMIEKETPAVHVGLLLRQLRQERRISIRELGRLSGLSANALSMIERGRTSPSVSTLYRLTDALGVPVTALFRQDDAKQPVVFRSVSQRARVPFPHGVWEGLGGESFTGRTQPFMLTLKSGAQSGPEKIIHTGSEFVVCLRGLLEYEVEGKLYTLQPGDSLLFAARLAHRWRNPSSVTTHAIFVLSGFEEYEKPGLFHLPPSS
jgi:transcriptional regulator with XRE-family HTH domain